MPLKRSRTGDVKADGPPGPEEDIQLASTSGPPSSFAIFRAHFKGALSVTVENFRKRRESGDTEAIPREEMDAVVEGIMDMVDGRGSEDEEQWRKTVRGDVVDRSLEEMLSTAVMLQSEATTPEPNAYTLLGDLLDLILTFSEHRPSWVVPTERGRAEYAESTLPLSCVEQLLELLTIAGCEHIFTYIESRVDRLTMGMHPQKGKGPLLLRLLNELLRRLPKSKTEHVIFSGRILMFLSSVFPLGEKSGVNLRGNFNIGKGTVFEGKVVEVEEGAKEEGDDEMAVDDKPASPTAVEAEDFYTTFWSLQIYFNNPPILFGFGPPPTSTLPVANRDPFEGLRHGLVKTLEVFAAATKADRELLGSSKEGQKVKAKSEEEDAALEHYFFPKFLTSRNLLDLELADTTFRRQILIQMLVLFQYLLSLTPAENKKSLALPITNMAALPSYLLPPAIEKWVNEIKAAALSELSSMPGGSNFKKTVELILLREQNWINWKLKSCLPFEKPSIPDTKSKLAKDKLTVITRKPRPFPYRMGNPSLSNLWSKNSTSLEGLEVKPSDESFDMLVRNWRMTNKKMVQVQTGLSAAQQEPKSAETNSKVRTLEAELETLDIKSKALHWRALRVAATSYLHLFSGIISPNLDALVQAIEDEQTKKAAIAAGLLNVPLPAPVEPEVSTTEPVVADVAMEVVEGTVVEEPVVEEDAATVADALARKEVGTPKRPRVESGDTMSRSPVEPEAKKVKSV